VALNARNLTYASRAIANPLRKTRVEDEAVNAARAPIVALPEGFSWESSERGRLLRIGSMDVLEVRRQRGGWVVEILVPLAHDGPNTLVVGSMAAGLRCGARWARNRRQFLAGLACGPSEARAATGPGSMRHAAASPARLSRFAGLAVEIDELRRLKGQLDRSLNNLEIAYGKLLSGESERAAALEAVDALVDKLPRREQEACRDNIETLRHRLGAMSMTGLPARAPDQRNGGG
jgi:hypothetical protein